MSDYCAVGYHSPHFYIDLCLYLDRFASFKHHNIIRVLLFQYDGMANLPSHALLTKMLEFLLNHIKLLKLTIPYPTPIFMRCACRSDAGLFYEYIIDLIPSYCRQE